MRRSTGAIFLETRPETIITSACRGEARNVSAPNLERSLRAETVFIISIAQHARPNVAGHRLLFRAQLTTASSFTVTTSGNDSNNVFSKPMLNFGFWILDRSKIQIPHLCCDPRRLSGLATFLSHQLC